MELTVGQLEPESYAVQLTSRQMHQSRCLLLPYLKILLRRGRRIDVRCLLDFELPLTLHATRRQAREKHLREVPVRIDRCYSQSLRNELVATHDVVLSELKIAEFVAKVDRSVTLIDVVVYQRLL